MSEPDIKSLSMMVFFFIAEKMPAGMPMAHATSGGKDSELLPYGGKASIIRSVTLRFSL